MTGSRAVEDAYEETTYDKLDVGTQRDRRGRLTRFTYNETRQLVATRDPAGRVIQQRWCPCGALEALIDANGHATTWTYVAEAHLSQRRQAGLPAEARLSQRREGGPTG